MKRGVWQWHESHPKSQLNSAFVVVSVSSSLLLLVASWLQCLLCFNRVSPVRSTTRKYSLLSSFSHRVHSLKSVTWHNNSVLSETSYYLTTFFTSRPLVFALLCSLHPSAVFMLWCLVPAFTMHSVLYMYCNSQLHDLYLYPDPSVFLCCIFVVISYLLLPNGCLCYFGW